MIHIERMMRRRTALMAGLIVMLTIGLLLATPTQASTPLRFVVSPAGDVDGAGTHEEPMTFDAALAKVAMLMHEGVRPEGGVEVVLQDGHYPIRQPAVLGHAFAGTAESPIVIRAADGAHVVFDGGVSIDPRSFASVTDPAERERLAASAVDQIVVATIEDPRLVRMLAREVMLNLNIDGTYHLPSVFPNDGYARLDNDAVEPEQCPPGIPVGQQAYGVRAGQAPHCEPGKPAGWKGSIDEPRGAWARLATGEDVMAGSWTQWATELARDNTRHHAPGFLEADWLLSSIPFVAADVERRALHLSRVLSYGWAWRKTKELKVFGLLCELDQPGEWHFDPQTRRLFLYPPDTLTAATRITLPIAEGFLRLDDGAAHIRVQGVHVRNIAKGWAFELRGSHNTLASSSVREATAGGVSIEGTHNRVTGCDFVDLNRHARLAGGRRNPAEIVDGHNTIENCHFYQRTFRHQKVSIGIVGVGNVFRNNLIHNSLGQAATVNGNDHLIERNEFFNVGFDEGDGGAIYAGGDLTGYGITFRHNFFHHLMEVPGKVGRHGIHLDDFQAGAICDGNVFYKATGIAIGMNHGAAHRVVNNVFLAGRIGPLNRGSGSLKNQQRAMRIYTDPDNPHRGSKEDYLGRAIEILGPEGWTRSPWRERFPLMHDVLSDTGAFGRFWPIRCEIRDNFYYDNVYDRMIWDRVAPEAKAKSVVEGETVIAPDAFVDYDTLDLRCSDAAPDRLRAADIPFEMIGLYLGPDRARMPDKQHYRAAVLSFFDGVPVMPGTHDEIDSGRVVEEGPVLTWSGDAP